jgi:uncharacterized protein DUF4082
VSYPSSRGRLTIVAALVLLLLLLAGSAARADAATTSLFDLDVAGPQEADGDSGTVELGVRVKAAEALDAQGIAFYRAPGHPLAGGRVHLWKGEQLVASGQADATAADGWVRVDFDGGAYPLAPGTEYVASYTAVGGDYVSTTGFFENPYTAGTLRAPVDAGVYRYVDAGDPPQRPTDSWASSNYWVTVYGEPGTEEPPAEPATGPWSLFDSDTIIANPFVDDRAQVELGVRFRVDAAQAYTATAIRIYRDPRSAMADNYGFVYDEDGTMIAYGLLANEGGFSGHLEIRIPGGVRLEPGKTYTASYLSRYGYPEEQHGFAESVQAGPISFPADAGVYRYGGGFPTDSWEATNYYVSPVVDVDTSTPEPAPVGAPGDVTAPVVQFNSWTFSNGILYGADRPVRIYVPVTDAASPLKGARLYVDGVLRQRVTKVAFSNQFEFLLLVPTGSHTIRVEGEDAAGNVGTNSISFYAQ